MTVKRKLSKESSKSKKRSTKSEMRRFVRRPFPDEVRKALRQVAVPNQFPIVIPSCEPAANALNGALNKACALKSEFIIGGERGCVGATDATSALVDLVILIDTSPSMDDEATELSNAAAAAVQAAQGSCPSDLRVCWLGIEGVWANTRFTQSYRNFLKGQLTTNKDDCRYSGTPVSDSDLRGYPGDKEDGAAAIMDIAEHFDWRSGAVRTVFFLGDEGLERGGPHDANDDAAAQAAIGIARERRVTVFTYYGTPWYPESAAETAASYRKVATDTGGQFFSAPASNIGGFQAILEQIICAASHGRCSEVKLPAVRPCFTLTWGDGPADRIETDDTELMCIRAVNPYSNITFKDVTVLISIITEEDGSYVPDLPNRTPSVYVKPLYLTCFGDLPPCDPKDTESGMASREFVLVSKGAKEGKYRLYLLYCYSIEVRYFDLDSFGIELVES